MARFEIANLSVYRWRYYIGYGLVGLLLIGLLVIAGLFVPGGISQSEMTGVIRTGNLSFDNITSLAVPNLPYFLLQLAGFELFGISDLTIKLPSLLLALGSAIGLIFLLKRWFKPRIAVLASLIAVTTGQFLFVAQNGFSGILYIFWPVMLLLIGTYVTRATRFKPLWKILFFAVAALSLYTPLSIYPLIAIGIATILHPHLRYAVRKLRKVHLVGAIALSALLVAPLIAGIITNPSLGLTLLGITNLSPDLARNFVLLSNQYLTFWQPSTTALMTPIFGLGSALLVVLGFFKLIKSRETTHSYLIVIWLACLLPVLIINPNFTSVLFVPTVLLLAMGLSGLIDYWYRLFPSNPYARIAGLLPLIVLVATLIGSGLDRYVYGYYFSPQTSVLFSNDLTLLPKDTSRLIVSADEKDFYAAVAKYRQGLDVTADNAANEAGFTTTRAAKADYPDYRIDRIITSAGSAESDRFYVYKKVAE